MSTNDITDPTAVDRAIEEHNDLGRDAFLRRYGFGRNRGWVIVGKQGQLPYPTQYDAKAILGVAHGYQFPAEGSLRSNQFYGGEPTARKLRALGFVVAEQAFDTERGITSSPSDGAIDGPVAPPDDMNPSDQADLRLEAGRSVEMLEAEIDNIGPPERIATTVNRHRRNVLMRALVLAKANGSCELCDEPAPFQTREGTPYLEVHHVKPLAQDGLDVESNMAALCPACHREVHFGVNSRGLNAELLMRIHSRDELTEL